MNVLSLPPRDAALQPADAQADAFDDTYAWVGYESAQPLTFTSADQGVWAGSAERSAD